MLNYFNLLLGIIIFIQIGYSNFLKTDFHETKVLKIYMGPYFHKLKSIYINDDYIEIKIKNKRARYDYKIIDVNNYYPIVKNYPKQMRNKIKYSKRYNLIIKNDNQYRIMSFIWYRDKKSKKIYCFINVLYTGDDALSLIKKYKKEKKQEQKIVFLRDKKSHWIHRYTQFYN